MVAPPYFPVPPDGYGGVEAVVADLIDGLVERGHHVTLIGAGGHRTKAQRFVATRARTCPDQLGEPMGEVLHAARVIQALDGLGHDLVHDHTLAGPLLAPHRRCPTVVTAHGPVEGDPGAYYHSLGEHISLVAISQAQRKTSPDLAWLATIHNAVRVETFPFNSQKERFALFLGRFHPDKAPHLAIDAAREAGLPIVLAGKCAELTEKSYFEAEVEPRLGRDVTLFGVAGAVQKRDLLARASCLLFPVRWDEPFGLVMVEAMACGTPVIALRRGAVPEVVIDGETGIIVDDPADLGPATAAACSIDPFACRRRAERAFGVEAMAEHYETAYLRALDGAPCEHIDPRATSPSVASVLPTDHESQLERVDNLTAVPAEQVVA